MSFLKLKDHKSGVKKAILPLCIATCTSITAINNAQADAVKEAFTSGSVKTSFRLRFEDVNQDTNEAAQALTLKSRLTMQTGEVSSTSALLEFDNNTALTEVDYSDGATGRGTAVIADPQYTEVNQAYLSFKGIGKTDIKLGRQRILLDNQRFVGGVGFRQNEQTYDALSVSSTPAENLNVFYAYVGKVNKIFGENSGLKPGYFESESHLLNASLSAIPVIGKVTAYAYMLDLLTPTGGAANSSDTFGFRLNNSFKAGDLAPGYTLEYAMQSNAADNTNDYDASYMLLEGNATLATVKFTVGYEVLGSDEGTAAFNTPLATLHKFQGWTDNFLATPTAGIVDTYVSAASSVAGIKLVGVFHTLSKDEGDGDYGTEMGLVVAKDFDKTYGLSLKFADYSAEDGSGTLDTTKLWLTATANF